MYSFDQKNVARSGALTCLFTKATIDESNLWHRRLGHINFKTMNKLVRGNLVRGLPLKIFENDHTCVACQKGKQHKASYDKDADEAPGKGGEGVSKGSEIDNQERFDSSTQDVNIIEPSINTANTNINIGSLNINNVVSNDPSMPSLEESGIFNDVYDDREVGVEADTNNLELSTVIEAIQEELLQFKLQKVWTLVDLPNGLQVKQKDDGIFISQDKYVAYILKRFDFITVKRASTLVEPNKALIKDAEAEDLSSCTKDFTSSCCEENLWILKGQSKLGIWYPRDSPFDLEAFSDSDYARASLNRISITGEYVAALAAVDGCLDQKSDA
uniref:Ribonuclease H-like domain-containing protein n=1 Tax=Tanacetum cinerariifolium TaxID=118510 RepID=A0A699HN40_TANCI|nr:ribonuclease H-like domain-containing protein [Tanacetum cinerariifolium]